MSRQSYTVAGMTCQHCVNAVTQEVRAIDGVTDVAVDLDSGGLTLIASVPIEDSTVAAAVDAAGYALAG